MTRVTIDGTLTVKQAIIDFADESARCTGVFRSTEQAALEVQYRVVLDYHILKRLSHAFTVAGVPLIRLPEERVSLSMAETAPSNVAGNGNGHKIPSRSSCKLCGAALYARAVPLGYCRICRTTRPAECPTMELTMMHQGSAVSESPS